MNPRHQHTYDALFQEPIARHLHRRDVASLLDSLADVSEASDGTLRALRNGQTLVLQGSRDRNVAAHDELLQVRQFLERSGGVPAGPAAGARHLLVAIDHREARIFEAELQGAEPLRITPLDPQGFGRNLHYVQDDSNGQRKPESKSFYEAIAKALRTATQVLLVGGGTGASSAMDHLMAELRRRHPAIANRVIGRIVLDLPHLTEGQLLAKAREFYADHARLVGSGGGTHEPREAH